MILPDSGQRSTYESGAQRDNRDGKGRYDLISPYALRRLAMRLELGAQKYSERNWEKGMPASRYVDALLRHAGQLLMGENSEDHVGAILFNATALAHTLEMVELGLLEQSLDDLPYYEQGPDHQQTGNTDSARTQQGLPETNCTVKASGTIYYHDAYSGKWLPLQPQARDPNWYQPLSKNGGDTSLS